MFSKRTNSILFVCVLHPALDQPPRSTMALVKLVLTYTIVIFRYHIRPLVMSPRSIERACHCTYTCGRSRRRVLRSLRALSLPCGCPPPWPFASLARSIWSTLLPFTFLQHDLPLLVILYSLCTKRTEVPYNPVYAATTLEPTLPDQKVKL